jgi:nucleoside-diphosphate-sugar epimerase
MNILLVGHEGYLGRGLLEYLSVKHRVIGWDKKENLFNLTAQVLAREDIEALINLAVMDNRGAKNYQIDTPGEDVNVLGARHIATILKGSQIAWFQFSTREVFGPVFGENDVRMTETGLRPKFLVDESFPFAPQNFYGKSKLVAEFISEAHPYSNVIRLTTAYTDHSHASGVWVLSLLRGIVEGKPITLTRGGEQFRDPLHTDDIGRLIEDLYANKVFGEKINAGGGEDNLISLKEFVQIADSNVAIAGAPGGDYGFAFDSSKALKLTGWKPETLIRSKIATILKSLRA